MTDDPHKIGKLLGELGTTFGIASPAQVGKLWAEWPGIVGPGIAAHASPTSLRDGVLRVRADSSAWATELGYLGGEIKSRVNRALGAELVREVKVWVGPKKTSEAAPAQPHRSSAKVAGSPPTEDPEEAFARAHRAWARRVGKPLSQPSQQPSENQEKPR